MDLNDIMQKKNYWVKKEKKWNFLEYFLKIEKQQ